MDACWWLTNLPLHEVSGHASCDLSAKPKFLRKSLAYLRVELHQTSVANIAKLRAERHRRRSLNTATAHALQANPHWRKHAGAEQRAVLTNVSSVKLASLQHWGATSLGASSDEEVVATHAEMTMYLQSLLSEQKEDIHRERFFATPVGLFDNMWEAVLVRDDLDHAVHQRRAHRLRAPLHTHGEDSDPELHSGQENIGPPANVEEAGSSEPTLMAVCICASVFLVATLWRWLTLRLFS